MTSPNFLRTAGRILNSGQARTLLLTGNIHDLLPLPQPTGTEYVPLIPFLGASWNLPDVVVIVYELNAPVRFLRAADAEAMREAWLRWRTGRDVHQVAMDRLLTPGPAGTELDAVARHYDDTLRAATGNPTLALEFLRQLCLCARGGSAAHPAQRHLRQRLLILIEGADLLLPDAPVPQLSDADRHRVGICADWFGDPGFMAASDSVVLFTESRSLLNQRLARLPQILEVEVPAPDVDARLAYIRHFTGALPADERCLAPGTEMELAAATAGLSLHALGQLLRGARHDRRPLSSAEVTGKVEAYIQSQLGDDVVEFKRPQHTFADVIGNRQLKAFLQSEFIPRLRAGGSDAWSGAAVCGPIGGGKTFVFEAVATELEMPVLVLKNLRSQWFGQTDVIFERLRRVLLALAKVLIFVDEADTQFGGVGSDTHETERRLTGKVQALMSDTSLRGRVVWLLVTARIHRLSADLRRPGRAGDLIIPTLDPEGEDRAEWLRWVTQPVCPAGLDESTLRELNDATAGWSAAQFAALRSELKAIRRLDAEKSLDCEILLEIVRDQLSPPIAEMRRYQTLQALVHCTRRRLLPDPGTTDAQRQEWTEELRALEARGVR